MNLSEKKVCRGLNEYSEIKSLMKRVFPPEELFPFCYLMMLSKRRCIEFTAYYDGDVFCGITYTVNDHDMAFLLYLAVNDKLQSKGYGSAILNLVKKKYQGKTVSLSIEPLVETASNYQQRKRRFEFYRRNSFVSTDCCFKDSSGEYLILSSDESFSLDVFRKVITKLSFGLRVPTLNIIGS